MDQIPCIKQILENINSITYRIWELSDKITNLLSNYDIENSNSDELLKFITSRNELIDELSKHQQQLSTMIERMDNNNSLMDDNLKDSIISKLNEIIKSDDVNRKKISEYRDSIMQKSLKIKKGKKFIKGYDVFPHRKAIFLDIAVSD